MFIAKSYANFGRDFKQSFIDLAKLMNMENLKSIGHLMIIAKSYANFGRDFK